MQASLDSIITYSWQIDKEGIVYDLSSETFLIPHVMDKQIVH